MGLTLTMTQVTHAGLFCSYDRICTPRLRLQYRVNVVMSTLPLVRAFSSPRSYTNYIHHTPPRNAFCLPETYIIAPPDPYDGA